MCPVFTESHKVGSHVKLSHLQILLIWDRTHTLHSSSVLNSLKRWVCHAFNTHTHSTSCEINCNCYNYCGCFIIFQTWESALLYASKESRFSYIMIVILNETLFQMSVGGNRKMTTTATRRLKQDYLRIRKDPVPYICAEPLPSNILEWYKWVWITLKKECQVTVFGTDI